MTNNLWWWGGGAVEDQHLEIVRANCEKKKTNFVGFFRMATTSKI